MPAILKATGRLARRGHREPENQGGRRCTHLISQLFYDNEDFYRFLDKAHAAGIDVPIEAGIMPVRGAKSVRRMAKVNASRIPAKLEALLDRWGDDIQNLRAAGIITPPTRSRTSWPTASTACTCIR